MSDQHLDQQVAVPVTPDPTTVPAAAEPVIGTAVGLSASDLNAARRAASTTPNHLETFLQDQQNFQSLVDNAERLKKEGLLSEEIWRLIRDQNINSQIDAVVARQVASHLHTAGENRNLSQHDLIKLMESVDTQATRILDRTKPEKALSYEVEKLADVLSPHELKTIAAALDRARESNAEATERERQSISRILNQISHDQTRLAKLGLASADSQVVAHHLANRVFDHNGGAVLARILVQSAATEPAPARELAQPAKAVSTSDIQAERAKLVQEVQAAALAQARRDFERDPGSSPDLRNARITLRSIINRHPGLQSDPEIQKVMLDNFQRSYEEQFRKQYDSLNFIQKGYYTFTHQWKENFSQIGAFIDRTIDAVKSIPSATISMVQNAGAAISTTAEKVTSVVGSTITGSISTAKQIWTAVSNPELWSKIGSGIARATVAVGDFAVDVFSDPSKAWATMKTVATTAWDIGAKVVSGSVDLVCRAGKAIGNYAVECWNDPMKLLRDVHAIGAALGINDMLWGTCKFVEGTVRLLAVAPAQLGWSSAIDTFKLVVGLQSFDQFTANLKDNFSGSFGEAAKCFKESARLVKGAAVLFGELSGISDLGRAVYYFSQGDLKMAALHGSFALMSAGSIAWTISTAGAGGGAIFAVMTGKSTVMEAVKKFGQIALNKAAIEGTKALAEETGKKVIKGITTEIGSQFEMKIALMTEKVVEEGVTKLAKSVAKEGRDALVGKVALQNIEKNFAEAAYKHTHKLLKELKVYDRVKSSVLELLQQVDKGSIKELEQVLAQRGMGAEAAHQAAKELRKAFRKGASDHHMMELLTDGITQEIKDAITTRMEKQFKDSVRTALRGELETKAGRRLANEMREKGIKLTEKEIDDAVEAAWKGCREGVERAVREVVQRAVHDAFKEYRRKNSSLLKKQAVKQAAGNPEQEEPGLDSLSSPALPAEQIEAARLVDVETRRIFNREKNTLLGEATVETEKTVI